MPSNQPLPYTYKHAPKHTLPQSAQAHFNRVYLYVFGWLNKHFLDACSIELTDKYKTTRFK